MPRIPWLPVSDEILGRAGTRWPGDRSSPGRASVRCTAETFGECVRIKRCTSRCSRRSRRPARQATPPRGPGQAAPTDPEQGGPWAEARAAAKSAGVSDWMGMHAQRERYRAAYRGFFTEWDVLLAPITLRTAFPHIDLPWPPPETPGPLTMVEIDGAPSGV